MNQNTREEHPEAAQRPDGRFQADPVQKSAIGIRRDTATAHGSAPSAAARVLAFAAIVIGGACGGLIGFAVMDIDCKGDCTTTAGVVGLAAAASTSAGTALIAALMLRSSAEWRTSRQSGSLTGTDAPNSTNAPHHATIGDPPDDSTRSTRSPGESVVLRSEAQ